MFTVQEVRVQWLLAFFFIGLPTNQDVEGIKEIIHLCFSVLQLIFIIFTFLYSPALSIKTGICNFTITTPGLFACEKVSFKKPFNGRQDVKFSFPKATQQTVIVVQMARLFGWNLWIIKNLQFVFWSTEMVLVGLRK